MVGMGSRMVIETRKDDVIFGSATSESREGKGEINCNSWVLLCVTGEMVMA